MLFQSTLSKRRATQSFGADSGYIKFQSTLSKRRATYAIYYPFTKLLISIHALQAESDSLIGRTCNQIFIFQSTLSKRRATSAICFSNCSLVYFNPRSPSGERQANLLLNKIANNFNPRSPSGERLL